jgi:hypothetical protein
MSVTMDKVVESYINTRQEIASIEKEMEARITPLKEVQDRREQYMMGQLNEIGAQNVKTSHGTVYQARKESVRVSEWDIFIQWAILIPATMCIEAMIAAKKDSSEIARELPHWIKSEFFNKAVNKTAVLEAMGADRTEQPPPGVDYTAIRTVQIRKS